MIFLGGRGRRRGILFFRGAEGEKEEWGKGGERVRGFDNYKNS